MVRASERDLTEQTSRSGRWRRPLVMGAILLFLAGASACSSDPSSEPEPETTTVTEPAAATSTEVTDEEPDDESSDDAPDDETADDTPITSEDICSTLTAAMVVDASGVQINEAIPSDSSTPQCSYTYPSENGPDSNLTVAATRYTAADAQSSETAYDSAVRINLSTAGGNEAEQVEVDAGDEAVVISGVSLDLGVLRVGSVLASLIVPPDVMTPAQAEALMVAIGEAFA